MAKVERNMRQEGSVIAESYVCMWAASTRIGERENCKVNLCSDYKSLQEL